MSEPTDLEAGRIAAGESADGDAAAAPSSEAPSVEEPSVEEPSVEEPSVEEPSAEEQESAGTDDLVSDAPVDDAQSSAADDDAASAAADRGRAPSPSPTRGAQAASRARRIGGRPLPGPAGAEQTTAPSRRPSPSGPEQAEPAASRWPSHKAAKSEPTDKPARTRREKPAKAPRDEASLGRTVARAGLIVSVIAGLAAATLLGIGVWLSNGVWWAKTSTDGLRIADRTQVLAIAKTCTAKILSYDYRTLAASEKSGQSCTTGQLASDYTQLMDKTVKVIAPQTKVVQVFQVANAGITSVSPDGKQWVVLVYGQESVTSTSTGTTPRLDISSAEVTLNKVGKTWLVSNMTTTS